MEAVEEVQQVAIGKILDAPPDGWINSDAKAAEMGVSRARVNQMAKAGQLEYVQVAHPGRGGHGGASNFFRPDGVAVQTRNVAPASAPVVQPPAALPTERKVIAMPQRNMPVQNAADALVTGLMQARGLTWDDLADHLGLVPDTADLVARWVGEHGPSALAPVLLNATPRPQGVVAQPAPDTGEIDRLRALVQEGHQLRDGLIAELAAVQRKLADRPQEGLNAKTYAATIADLSSRVRERDDELKRKEERIKSLELQIEQLRKRGLQVDALTQQVEDANRRADVHASGARSVAQQLATSEETNRKLTARAHAAEEEALKYQESAEYFEAQVAKLRASLDAANTTIRKAQLNGQVVEEVGPVMVSHPIYNALLAMLDPKHHPSGNRDLVHSPWNRNELIRAMQKSGNNTYKSAARWLELHAEEYEAGIGGRGFASIGDTAGRVFRVQDI